MVTTRANNQVSALQKIVLAFSFMILLLLPLFSNFTFQTVEAQNATSSSDPAGNSTSTTNNSTATSGSNEQSQNDVPQSSETTQNQNQTQSSSNSTSPSVPESSYTSTNSTETQDQQSNSTASYPLAPDATATQNIPITDEPLILTNSSITRSYSYPILKFEGEVAAELGMRITWNTDGTTEILDSRGYSYSIAIPKTQGEFTLWQNSTVVDQKVVGSDLQYDIYWRAVQNSEGYVDRYKFTIVGTSLNASIISLKIDAGKYFLVDGNNLVVTQPAANSNITNIQVLDPTLNWNPADAVNANASNALTTLSSKEELDLIDNLKLDWSDAIASGYSMSFNSASSSLDIPVLQSFLIDPTVVTTVSGLIAPTTARDFEGQKRMISISDGINSRLYVFYYDLANIVYRTSDDEGETWSTATSVGTGMLDGEDHKWSMIKTIYDGIEYVNIFYWTDGGDVNANFYTIRGTANGLDISWSTPILLGYVTDYGPYAAVSAAADSDGSIYAAFRFRVPTSPESFSFVIKKSTDAGLTWSDSIQIDGISGTASNQPAMTLTSLDENRMLFVYAVYGNSNLFYRVFDGSWGSEQTVTNTGLIANSRKQLSSTSDIDGNAYVAFTSEASIPGPLKVAFFSNTGTFQSVETADSTLEHFLPNIMYNGNGDINVNSLARQPNQNTKIYNIRKVNGIWEAPFTPYGTVFDNPNQLTATNVLDDENVGLWTERLSTPYNLVFGILEHGTVELETSVQSSPALADYYEGERRVVSNINGTLFSFYYDGSNIVYKKSFDDGHTWSSNPTSTGSGTIASDNYRWTLAHAIYNGEDRIVLLYYAISGANTNFYQKTFKAFDSGLVLVSTVNSFSAANDPSCTPTGVCAAAAGSSDSNSNLYAAYRWKSGGVWHYKIVKSADGGSTWTTSLDITDVTATTNQLPITMTFVNNSTKMLFAYTTYESGDLYYRIFDGTSWGAVNTITAGITVNTVKQISSGTVDLHLTSGAMNAYVAFLANGNQGVLKVARFSNTGTFEIIETADSTLVHWLPSISVSGDGVMHIFSLAGGIIYDTQKTPAGWQSPVATYGTDYYSANQLTSQISHSFSTGVFWRSGSTSPYSLLYAGEVAGTVGTATKRVSPTTSSSYEGEKRIVRTAGALFAFYYDGSNIVYKYSTAASNGATWCGTSCNSSSPPISTGTQTIANDYERWTIGATKIGSTNYIYLLYFKPSGSSTIFYAKRGTVSDTGTTISWSSTPASFTVTNSRYGAAVASADSTSNNIFVAFRWEKTTTSTYEYKIMKIANGGTTWTTSLTTTSSSSSYRISMALTKLSTGKMLFAYFRYDSPNLFYKVLDGSWVTKPDITSTGFTSNVYKQVSAASDSTGKPYLTYVGASSTYGTSLKVVTWTNTGTSPTVTTVDSTIGHRLPSIIVTAGDRVHIYFISKSSDGSLNNKVNVVSEFRNGSDIFWSSPYRPYNQGRFVYSDQLTVSIPLDNSYTDAMWKQSSNIKSAGFLPFFLAHVCDHVASLPPAGQPCFSEASDFYGALYSITGLDKYYYATPFSTVTSATCSYPCINTDYQTKYPRRITVSFASIGYQYEYETGFHQSIGKNEFGVQFYSTQRWDLPQCYPAIQCTQTFPLSSVPTAPTYILQYTQSNFTRDYNVVIILWPQWIPLGYGNP